MMIADVEEDIYKWQDTKGLFDGTAVEECGSSILNIVRDYAVDLQSAVIRFRDCQLYL